MRVSPEKQARIDEVQKLLDAFSKEHLTQELTEYLQTLWEKVGRKRTYVITGGKKEIWASAVVYVIARLNFLFDPANPNYLTADQICAFFGTKKSTVASRAGDIEKAGIIYNLMKDRVDVSGFKDTLVADDFSLASLPEEIWRTKLAVLTSELAPLVISEPETEEAVVDE